MAGNVDSSDISEAIKEYLLPFTTQKDGVRVPISLVQLVDGTKRPIPFVSGSAPWGNGVPNLVRDTTLNDADKDMVLVPAGKYYVVESIMINLITTATVGNRVLTVSLRNAGGDVIFLNQASAVVASSTGNKQFSINGSGTAAHYANALFPSVIPAGYYYRIYDSNATDPAADDMTVSISYKEYDA